MPKERAKIVIRHLDIVGDIKHAKPLKKKKKYTWKELIVWDLTQKATYKIKAESPTVLSLVGIVLFMWIASAFTTAEQQLGIFGIFLLVMFFMPVLVEYGEKIVLANTIGGLDVVHMDIRHVEEESTFQIRDVVKKWKRIPYSADSGASHSEARNRAGLELEFRHPWQIGNPENPHMFRKIRIFGSSPYFRSLDTLAPKDRLQTDIFGVNIPTGVYEFGIKVREKDWNPTTNSFVSISWYTRENGNNLKNIEPFLVKSSKEGEVLTCVHCSMPQSYSEDRIASHHASQTYKEETVQANLQASHEETLREKVIEADFNYAEIHSTVDDYYKVPYLKRIKIPKYKWWEWLIVFAVVFGALYLVYPPFRVYIQQLWASIGGSPAETGNGEI